MTERTEHHRGARSREAGFTLVEMLVSMGILLVVIGAVFNIVDPSQGISKAQPEVIDMQERMRVAADVLQKDLLMAGAGTYSGSAVGALANFFPPIMPRKTGMMTGSDPDTSAFDDRISIAYVPDTASQTTVSELMPQPSSEIKTTSQPGCPEVTPPDNLCGFKEGMRVLIFDDTGAYDFFTITQVQTTGPEGHLQHNPTMNANADLSKAYDKGAQIAQVETHVYWIDRPQSQLRHFGGTIQTTETPLVDNFVNVRFTYYGDPNPPLAPRPKAGSSNCIMDSSGNPTLPVIESGGSSLVELTPEMLSNGPWCGTSPNRFDADLFRIRKVRVELRTQAGLRELRGSNPTSSPQLFVNPGTSHSAYQRVPDYSMTIEVAPRNMNLVR